MVFARLVHTRSPREFFLRKRKFKAHVSIVRIIPTLNATSDVNHTFARSKGEVLVYIALRFKQKLARWEVFLGSIRQIVISVDGKGFPHELIEVETDKNGSLKRM